MPSASRLRLPDLPKTAPYRWLMVTGGYVAALCAAYGALYIRLLQTQGPDRQSMAGMYAFGDLTYFVAVFGFLALIPTVLALYFLRPVARFWTALSIVSMAIAGAGAAAVSAVVVVNLLHAPQPFWGIASAYGFLLVLGSPLLTAAFLACALVAPGGRPRLALFAATGIEAAVCVYLFIHLFL